MNKKKILKIVLISFLSLIVVALISSAVVFQFMIKPNINKIVETVDTVINDPEFIGELIIDENLEQEINETDLSGLIIDEKTETPQKPVEQPKKPKSEYKSTYDYVKDNIDASDFKTGASFASRINVSYILGLLKGGLTPDERKELKAYLKQHFTSAEISEGIALYKKYSYLLK